MSNDAIFLVSDSGQLQRVEHQLYASEDILQQLVAQHPEVLAGDQIDPAAPPRWLLIRREAKIPDSAGGTDRWWLDHLLLDQFGIPTLVEVKRSSDTRIRREVVGQMLDYVANAQSYWAAGRMRQMLAEETGSPEAADSKLAEHLAISDEPEAAAKALEEFWHKVEANMREGNVRLLFVADELPRELKRLIEFLNEQFTKIEVLGVELRQYVGPGIRALVPRVVGQTEVRAIRKSVPRQVFAHRRRPLRGPRASNSSPSVTQPPQRSSRKFSMKRETGACRYRGEPKVSVSENQARLHSFGASRLEQTIVPQTRSRCSCGISRIRRRGLFFGSSSLHSRHLGREASIQSALLCNATLSRPSNVC